MIPNLLAERRHRERIPLDLVDNYDGRCEQSKFYNFPAWPPRPARPEDSWLDNDPYGSDPADKLAVLKNANDWTTNLGHPGPANAAMGEIFALPTLPNMMARAATRPAERRRTPSLPAEQEINEIFDKWRAEGLMGGGA